MNYKIEKTVAQQRAALVFGMIFTFGVLLGVFTDFSERARRTDERRRSLEATAEKLIP